MKVAVALVLVSISAIVGPAATAATFDTYEEDGEEFCSLDLQGVDEMLISAEKGKGVTGEVWVEFMAERDRSFSSDMELRLEVTVGKDTTDAFIGGTEETDNIPGFLLPLSTVGELSTAATFTYQIEDRPAVSLKGMTAAEVKRLTECMQHD